MQSPKTITQAELTALKGASTYYIRLLPARLTTTRAPRLVRGSRDNYQMPFVPTMNCHALDIPLIPWMTGATPSTRYPGKSDTSIAKDISLGSSDLIMQVIAYP